MEAVDIVGLLVPVTYAFFAVTERLRPARVFPPRPGWQWIGAGFLVLIATVSTLVPLRLSVEWMAAHRWLDGTKLGVAGGTVIGYVVLSGVAYAYHRTVHSVPVLWRLTHQLHHSPNRVDIPGAVLFHPVEMTIQALMHLFVTVIVLGLDPLAAALTGYVAAFYGMFQHWNVRTPPWLGYLIQRPEAHGVHHRLGMHDYNFGDLPWWDLLFGTFRNPREFRGDVGFEGGADRRIGAMLALADVNAPAYGPASLGRRAAAVSGCALRSP